MSIFRKNKLDILPIPSERVDERDTMFARMERVTQSQTYMDYYNRYPGKKKKDDQIRSYLPLMHPDSKYYDIYYSEKARSLFDSIDKISIDNKIIKKYLKYFNSDKLITQLLKKITLELGAVAAGCTKIDKYFVYSHKGRFDNNFGREVKLSHKFALIFLVEMDFLNMQSSPKAQTIYESANQYYQGAKISKIIEALLMKLGYDAKAHYDTHYDIILPPLAVQAGLGEIGRNNILVADKYGSRVRIGAVTTNLPLEIDLQKSLGVADFCDICKKCATNCPSKALAINGKEQIRGVNKWPTNVENCYSLWRKYGTDCGICMAVCPFSHKNNLLHNFIRKTVQYLPMFNKFLVAFDDLIYGKKWKVS